MNGPVRKLQVFQGEERDPQTDVEQRGRVRWGVAEF